MANCEFLEKCAFFNAEEIASLHNLVDYLKNTFCLDDFTKCSRYQIAAAIGREHVPVLMTPDQNLWAQQILEDHQQNQEKTENTAD